MVALVMRFAPLGCIRRDGVHRWQVRIGALAGLGKLMATFYATATLCSSYWYSARFLAQQA